MEENVVNGEYKTLLILKQFGLNENYLQLYK